MEIIVAKCYIHSFIKAKGNLQIICVYQVPGKQKVFCKMTAYWGTRFMFQITMLATPRLF